VIPEGPGDLSGKSFLIWVVSSNRVKGTMERGWVLGEASDACACTEAWEEETSFASTQGPESPLSKTEAVSIEKSRRRKVRVQGQGNGVIG